MQRRDLSGSCGLLKGEIDMSNSAPSKDLTGKAFERLVAAVQSKLDPGSAVEWDIKVRAKSGALRQIDVMVRGKRNGEDVAIAIEAKDRITPVTIGMVGDFYVSFTGIGAQHGIIVSNLGFTEDALLEAKERGVVTCVLRPAKDEDWNGCAREINMRISVEFVSCENAELVLMDRERIPIPTNGKIPLVYDDGVETTVRDIVWNLLEQRTEIVGEYSEIKIESPSHYLRDDPLRRQLKGLVGTFRFVKEEAFNVLMRAPEDWIFVQHLPYGIVHREKRFFVFDELKKLADEFNAKKATSKGRTVSPA